MSNAAGTTPPGSPSPALLHALLEAPSRATPDAPALWWQGEPMGYAQLLQNSLACAARLSAQGATGERIAVLSWNRPEFVELIYGAAASGRILVPLNARLAPTELVYQLRYTGATTLFGSRALLQPLLAHAEFPASIRVIDLDEDYAGWRVNGPTRDLPPVTPQTPVWILFTSGSTGRPKGAVLSHRSFLAGLRSAALARPVEPLDRYYYPFPLFHVSAHNVFLQHRYGAAVVLAGSFDPGLTLRACRELRVTTMSLAPTMIGMLLDHPDFRPTDLQSVRTVGYGASAMPPTLLQRLLADTHVGLCQSYGMTELSGSIAFLTVEDHRRAARDQPALLKSVGRPLPTAKVKLIDASGRECAAGRAGEILVQAPQCMEAYWNDAEATRKALAGGWLHTGDIGRFDNDGYLYIVDRKKDMIISGGENIASREVEEALLAHAAVRDCAVVGLPDPKWGESVCAVLRLRDTASDDELDRYCRTLLAGYKVPKRWVRVDALPLNAAGKIDKPLLREQIGDPR